MAKSRSKSAFPIFNDGDVEIRLTRKPDDRFILHSVVLGLHSSFFKASLSKQWPPSISETAAEGGLKWNYELQFELGTSVGLLAKAQSTAATDWVSANTITDTAAIYLNETPWAPMDDDLTLSRLLIVEAHRQFLSILYHKLPTFSTRNFDSAITAIDNLIGTADAYDSLPIVLQPIENHLARYLEADTVAFCACKPHVALQQALKLRSGWMFKEVVGRLVGNPRLDDADIQSKFKDSGVVPLVLEKRARLRMAMMAVDIKLLTLEYSMYSLSNEIAVKAAITAFRTFMIQYINTRAYKPDRSQETWALYAGDYRALIAYKGFWDDSRYRAALGGIRWPARINEARFQEVFAFYQDLAAQTVAPLLQTTLGRYDAGDRRMQGFTCIAITDDDLPWKDTSW